jgi:CubicO group peptidase (beta-lactamase class C family)
MYSPIHKLILLSVVVMSFSSCSTQRKEHNSSNNLPVNAGCMIPKEAIAGKVQLENGMRAQVAFLDEPEALSSITNKMSEYKIPALSLTVIKQGKIEWADTYQNTVFSEQQKLNCTSLFQAASLSKPVTFLAAVRMYAAGKIDLDKNIQSYLKDFVLPIGKQTADNPVTFRNIFAHTSGITPGGYLGYAQDLALPSDIEILKGAAGVRSPAIAVIVPPNEKLVYSGGAYTLAELALQDTFNNEFASIMKKWILDPAGMKHSDFAQPLPASKHKQVAKGYTRSGQALEGGWRNHPEQAAAGLWSNSTDMAKFLIEIYKAYQGKSSVFSQSDIKSLISHERDGHIYGFRVEQADGEISITHYGGNTGYSTGMTINLSSGNGLVYLINSENGWALGRDLFLSASQVYNWKFFKQINAYRKHLDSEVLKGLSGKYKWNNQDDFSVRFDENNNLISLLFPGGDEYKLTPIVGDELQFIHPNSGDKVTFLKKDGIQSFSLYGGLAVKQH